MATKKPVSWQTTGDVEGLVYLSLDFSEDGDTFTVAGRSAKDGADLELEGGIEDGAVVFRSFSVTSDNITTDTPRLPIGAIRAEIRRLISEQPDDADATTQYLMNNWMELTPDERKKLTKKSEANRRAAHRAKAHIRSRGKLRGRRPLDDEFLARVAETYLSMFPDNQRNVTVAVTEALEHDLDRPQLPKSTVKSWIHACREQDWLAPSARGKATGKPGPRLLEWRESNKEAL